MAVIPTITIQNTDVSDALEAVEQVWKNDAERIFGADVYGALGPVQKLQRCIIAMLRVRTRNVRREKAERAVVTPPEPDVV